MNSSLQDEIRQSRPFSSPEQEVYLSLLRTASLLSDGVDRVLRDAGLTGPQYNVLRILRGAEPDGLCRNELRDRMLTRMPDMTRLLDRMEAAGLVRRERGSRDRRQVGTRITEEGLGLLAALDAPVAEEHRRRLGAVGEERLRALLALLAEVRAAAP
jgi:DNA-binding MarR family transcriptional regulator